MKPYFPTKELEQENERLIAMMLDSDEEISAETFVKKYASPAYLDHYFMEKRRKKRLRKQGIIEN